jgi:uncharacterized membrane-anchored protein YitT (DUF2179 family)
MTLKTKKDATSASPEKEIQKESIEIDSNLKKHTAFEDFQALAIGSLLVAFGVALFSHLELLIGGTAGVAFLSSYATGFTFGEVFFVINLPFYILAIARLGWKFTLKTFGAVLWVSFLSDYIPTIFELGEINPLFGAVLGGFMIGTGVLMLFRHKASLGGLNIISLYLQKYHNVNAGRFQMVVDLIIIICAFFIVDIWSIIYSIIASICMNLVLAINFIKGRYLGSLD